MSFLKDQKFLLIEQVDRQKLQPATQLQSQLSQPQQATIEDSTDLDADEALLADDTDDDVLSDDEEVISPPDDESDEEAEAEAEEKEEEVDEEEEEEVEDELPKDLLHLRPAIKDINKEFPNFFKKFPEMKDMYFREKEYSELFPSVADAKEANENNTAFSTLRDDVSKGDGVQFLSALKEIGSLEQFAGKFLPALYKVDKDTQWGVISPIIQNSIRAVYKEGKSTGDKNLEAAALVVCKFLLGDTAIARGEKSVEGIKTVEISPEKKKLDEERNQFELTKFQEHSTDVATRIDKGLNSLINAKTTDGKLRIDPNNELSPYLRSMIAGKILQQVNKELEKDPEHMKLMRSLWEKAKKNGYTGDFKSAIVSTFLTRAKSIVPTVRKKVVSEALGKRVKSRVEEIRREPGSSGSRSSERGNKNYSPKEIDYSKTSDDDILSDRVSLRK